MADAWTFEGAAPGLDGRQVTLVEGSTFCISDPTGDIRAEAAHGLFFRDTRILSRWRLTLDGSETEALTVYHDEPLSATFVCRAAPLSTASQPLLAGA